VYNAPFIVLDLGKHDCIISVKFMRRFRLLLEPCRNRFRWPSEYPRTNTWARDIPIQHRVNFLGATDPYVQTDANRRDKEIEKDNIRRKAGAIYRIVRTLTACFRNTPGLLPIPSRLIARPSLDLSSVAKDRKPNSSGWERSMRRSYVRMNKELFLVENPKPEPTKKRSKP
jgi:hypothetical protein